MGRRTSTRGSSSSSLFSTMGSACNVYQTDIVHSPISSTIDENLNWVVVVVEVALRNRSLVGGLRSCSSHLEDEEEDDDDEEEEEEEEGMMMRRMARMMLNNLGGRLPPWQKQIC